MSKLSFSSLGLQLQMSGCLGPPQSVYSSPFVIYFSPLVIYSCCLLGAFMTGLFTYFIHVIVYFFSISEHFATIISPELIVLFLDMFFQPIFCCKLHVTHTGFFFFMGVINCDRDNKDEVQEITAVKQL